MGLDLLGIKTYIQISVLQRHLDGQADQWSRTENPQINLTIYDKDSISKKKWEKIEF